MGKIVFGVVIFIILLILEFVMIGAYETSTSTKTKRLLSVFCRIILGLFVLGYLLLVAGSLFIGFDLLMDGAISKGVSVMLFSAIIAVCVYIWLIRGWFNHIKQMKISD